VKKKLILGNGGGVDVQYRQQGRIRRGDSKAATHRKRNAKRKVMTGKTHQGVDKMGPRASGRKTLERRGCQSATSSCGRRARKSVPRGKNSRDQFRSEWEEFSERGLGVLGEKGKGSYGTTPTNVRLLIVLAWVRKTFSGGMGWRILIGRPRSRNKSEGNLKKKGATAKLEKERQQHVRGTSGGREMGIRGGFPGCLQKRRIET